MMRKLLVVLLPLTPSNCVAANSMTIGTTGGYTIAKFQSDQIDTHETQYQRVELKEHIKFYSPTSFTNYNIVSTLHTLNMATAGKNPITAILSHKNLRIIICE
jgi:hypothetical protein